MELFVKARYSCEICTSRCVEVDVDEEVSSR